MAVLLGLAVAACFGSSDFAGGLASRRAPVGAVLLVSQVVSATTAGVYAVLFAAEHVTGRDVGLAAAAGVTGVVGLGLLYRGLSAGRMGIVAPITAAVASSLPVLWGLATGEDPGVPALAGVVVAIVAVVLVSMAPTALQHASIGRIGELVLAVGAGIGFGSALVLIAETGEDAGFWPVLVARAAGLPVVLGALLVMRRAIAPPTTCNRLVVAAGVLEATATALLLLAVRTGLVSLVAPVAALGPAFTVLWARLVLREPVHRVQAQGLVLALVGLVLIATG